MISLGLQPRFLHRELTSIASAVDIPAFDSHDDRVFCGHRGQFLAIPKKPTLIKVLSVANEDKISLS
jgi:hypothetical protein